MTKWIYALFLLIITTAFISCQPTKDTAATVDKPKEEVKEQKQNNPDDLINQTWTVSYIQDLDARLLPDKKSPTITFQAENKANIKLSVNSCLASYKVNETMIRILDEGCTEVCCDSDYDQKLMNLLRKNEFSYELEGNKLTLSTANTKIVFTK
jgi:heat shock protein HslJ